MAKIFDDSTDFDTRELAFGAVVSEYQVMRCVDFVFKVELDFVEVFCPVAGLFHHAGMFPIDSATAR